MAKKLALKSILTNKISGSSELLENINEYFLTIHHEINRLKSDIRDIRRSLSTFEVVNSYLDRIEKFIKKKDSNGLELFLQGFATKKDEAYINIYRNAKKLFAGFNTILTLSNSKTLLEVFKIWSKRNNKLNIIVCESRPKNEGVIFAKALAQEQIKVSLITDASMSNYIAKADTVIIGADIILKNGNVVNKTGSRNAAILCKHFNKPFIVIATEDKFSNKKIYKPGNENASDILKGNYNNIKVLNSYFEEVEKSLVTKIIANKYF